MSRERGSNGAGEARSTNVSEQKTRGSEEEGKAGEQKTSWASELFQAKTKETPRTSQKTKSQFVIPERQEGTLAEEPLPVCWQPKVSLISLHRIILESYQLLIEVCPLGNWLQIKELFSLNSSTISGHQRFFLTSELEAKSSGKGLRIRPSHCRQVT